MIQEFSGNSWNHRVPDRSITNPREITTVSEYWGGYLHDLRTSLMVTLNDVEIKDSRGRSMVDAKNNNLAKDIEYIKELLWIEANDNAILSFNVPIISIKKNKHNLNNYHHQVHHPQKYLQTYHLIDPPPLLLYLLYICL